MCVSGLMLITGLVALMGHTLVVAPAAQKTGIGVGHSLPPPMPFLFRYFSVLALAQVLLASFIMYSGLQFLRLRRWALASLEVTTWLALASVVALGGLIAFAAAGDVIAGSVIAAAFGLPLCVLLHFLRGAAVSGVFGHGVRRDT